MGSSSPPDGPLWVLQPSTVQSLSVLLDQEKLIPTDHGHLRDWRGVAEMSGLANDNIVYQRIANSREGHFLEIFNSWKKVPQARVKDLFNILEDIDRFDVKDDVYEKIGEDIKFAEETASKKGLDLNNLCVTDLAKKRMDNEEDALTYEDLDCLNKGQPLPTYDAFILYSDEDTEKVTEIVKNLEAQGLKIIIKDRDMLGGLFEHTAIMKLIESRCNKLITFCTPALFSSPYNKFLMDFAQWAQMEVHKKIGGKFIPIVTEVRCDIPPNLSIYSKMKYDPNSTLYNFWEKLARTINPSIKYDSEREPQTSKQPSAPSLSRFTTPTVISSSKFNNDIVPPPKPKSDKSKTEPKKLKLSIAEKMKSTKQSFSNILVKEDLSPTSPHLSEPSSLESAEVNGDSGALLLPDVPDHEPGGIKGFFSKFGVKGTKKSKQKYKQPDFTGSSAC